MTGTEQVAPRPSATVLLLRDLPGGGVEVHLHRRRADLDYGARALVFPGGSVDADDASPEALALLAGLDLRARAARMELSGDERLCAALHVCAIREVFEETGILLASAAAAPVDADRLAAARDRVLAMRGFAGEMAALGIEPVSEQLVYVARFITPVGLPRRFDTRFFAVRAPEGQIAAVHEAEAESGDWFEPAAVLASADAGDAILMPPTRIVLAELTRHRDVVSVLDELGSREVAGILFTLASIAVPLPDHLPTVAEIEAMAVRAAPG